jgi:membrane protein DedA with SNARE-associated domain
MDEAELPARPRPRWILPALLVPIGALVVMNTTAGILSATLVKRHPALLITLSSQNRWLILASNQLDPVTFYGIGFLRLVVADPLFYFLGYFYGDAALRWMERKMKEGATLFLWTEKAFKKARYPMVAIAPNNVICLLAGATQMAPPVFIGLNVVGTVARLYLIRVLGKTFSAPIDAVTGFLDRYRWPILAVCVVLFLVSTLLKDKGAKGELSDLSELRDEVEAAEGDA